MSPRTSLYEINEEAERLGDGPEDDHKQNFEEIGLEGLLEEEI